MHGDYRAANILCRGDKIAAVLDFEEARVDHPVCELALAAVLLGTRFHDWGPVSARTRATFLTGYESVRPLEETEASWWKPLVLWNSMMLVPAGADPTGWGTAVIEQLRGGDGIALGAEGVRA